MLTLYALIGIMLLCAIALLAIPFIAKRNFFSVSFLSVVTSFIIVSLSLYQFSGDKAALTQWLSAGQQHYMLMEQFEKLGGVEGAITKIEKKLKEESNDPQGWMILGKLYLSKHEDKKAREAFLRAKSRP